MSAVSDIFETFDHLDLETKRYVVGELQNRLEAEECLIMTLPEKTYLEKCWEEIGQQIYELSLEPYVDDQVEIDVIWEKIDEMIQSGRLSSENWDIRRSVLKDIVDNDFYDYYGVSDPMHDLIPKLLLTDTEKKQLADYLWETPKRSLELADQLYQEIGETDRHLQYAEQRLKDQAGPYLDLIHYYADKDEAKALKIAEQGRVKCRNDLDEIYIFMINCARKRDDFEEIKRLLRSAKSRRGADFRHIMQATKTEEMLENRKKGDENLRHCEKTGKQ